MTPTPTPPCLGEREAVARTETDDICRAIAGMLEVRVPGRLRNFVRGAILPLRTENETLRAEREQSEKHRNDLMDSIVSLKTERGALRTRLADVEAERDAAIARAEEVERRLQLDRQMAPERIAEMVEEYGAYDATCKLGKVYGTATIGEFVSALLATAKLAQAEVEIATMREALADLIAVFEVKGATVSVRPDRVLQVALANANIILAEHSHGD